MMGTIVSPAKAPLPDTPSSKSRELHKRLYHSKFALAIVLGFLGCIALFYFGTDTKSQAQWYAIAESLAASIIFSILFTVLANREFNRLVSEEIRTAGLVITSNVVEQIKIFHASYVPTHVFPRTETVDPNFNRLLMADLGASSSFSFRGNTGKYVAARIRHHKGRLNDVSVIMLDPTNPRAVLDRLKDRRKDPEGDEAGDAQLQEFLRDLYTSIIALFDCRSLCSIKIGYESGAPAARVELFDDAVYLSLYHTVQPFSRAFPASVRYARQSMFYELYRNDHRRCLQNCRNAITFESDTTEEQLINHLKVLQMSVAKSSLAVYRRSYHTFLEQFVSDAGLQ
jgi:hypothetical protein